MYVRHNGWIDGVYLNCKFCCELLLFLDVKNGLFVG